MSTVTKASVYSRTEDTPDTPSLASIDRFLDAVWMERGLSPNTLSAYRADLTALDRWLQGRGCSSLAAKRADVLAFIAFASKPARGRARRRAAVQLPPLLPLSDPRGRDQGRSDRADRMPKIGRSLPKSLTEEEVEALLAAPEIDDPLGNRDRSMLEVLYATGPARVGAGEPEVEPGQHESGRAAHRRQGRSRAPDPARRRRPSAGCRSS
jgi:integrase/recombinase XerD